MIWITDTTGTNKYNNWNDFVKEFNDALEEYFKKEHNLTCVAKNEPKEKKIGDYTLREIQEYCPFMDADFVDDKEEPYCEHCKFGNICALCPEDWDEDVMNSDGKPKMTDEERKQILSQIDALKKKLGE